MLQYDTIAHRLPYARCHRPNAQRYLPIAQRILQMAPCQIPSAIQLIIMVVVHDSALWAWSDFISYRL